MDLGVHDFIVGTNQFSCRQALTVDYIELKEIKEKYPMIRLFVLVNALVEQEYLDDLKNHLDKLNECQIDGIIFQDFGVLQICNEKGYSFEKIYDPETLNTNHLTLSVLKEQGIDGAFLAREIPLKVKEIPEKFKVFWDKYTSKQKTIVIAIICVVLIAIGVVAWLASRPTWSKFQVFDSVDDANTMTKALDDQSITWKASSDGKTIYVPGCCSSVGS